MADSNNEEQKLQLLVNKFDPKLELNKIRDLSYQRLVNWILPVQQEIDKFKESWRGKVKTIQENGITAPFPWANYQTESSLIHCFDEESFHLNNRAGLARFMTPHNHMRGIYTYTYPFNDYIAYEIAERLGWPTPATSLAIVESDRFHNVLDQPSDKICSVKTKIPNAVDPLEYTLTFFKERQGQPLKEILASFHDKIDQASFEETFLLTWLVGEISGEPSKYSLIPNNQKMSLRKVNSLTCLSNNYFEIDSFLLAFPHIQQTLSQENQSKLLHFDEAPIIELMKHFNKDESSIACFRDRVRRMKEIARSAPSLSSFVTIGLTKKPWEVQSFLLKLYHEGIAFT